MKKVFVFICSMMLSQLSFGQTVFFEEDFESPIYDASGQASPNPIYRWEHRWEPVSGTGMPFGLGDWFDRSTDMAHNGSYSMELDFEGRNDFGNTCLLTGFQPGSGLGNHAGPDGSVYYQDVLGRDLATFLDGLGAEPGTYVWNRTKYFERWTVEQVLNGVATNDRLNFVGNAPSAPPIYGETGGVIDNDDVVRIARDCPDGQNSNDLNLLENQLVGSSSADVPLGGSIFYRFYMFVPSTTVLPGNGHKLLRVLDNRGQGIICAMMIARPKPREMYCQDTTGGTGQVHIFTDTPVPLDQWVYFEIEVQRESSLGAADGSYRLWMDDDVTPLIDSSGVAFQEVGSNEFVISHANSQAFNRRTGSIYWDDLIVSDFRNGKIGSSPPPPPPPPTGGSQDAFVVVARDNGGATSSVPVTAQVNVVQNVPPTVSAFSGPVASGSEDTEVEITFAQLLAASDAADSDGSVTGFVIQNVLTGTLRIGSDSASATAFNAVSNASVTASLNAYWTPASNANGVLNAFDTKVVDDDSELSVGVVTATVDVAAVNDPPTMSSFSGDVASTDENVEVEITFTQLLALSDAADSDGSVTGFVIQSVPSGTLRIGVDSVTAQAYDPVTNSVISSGSNAYWTP